MEKKVKIVIIVLFIGIIAGAGFGAYEMEVGPFEDDDDDNGNGGNGPAVDENPVAIITANRTTGDPNWLFNFDGSGSYDDETNITSYRWNFDDGNTEENITAEHSWIQPGAYNVTLTVTDTDGNFNKTWMWVGITYREHQEGTTNGETDTFDFDMGDMAALLHINTTVQNGDTNVGDNTMTFRYSFNGVVVEEQTLTMSGGGGGSSGDLYRNETNLTAGTWTWELEINDSGVNCDLDWEVEVVIIYAVHPQT